MVFDAGHFLELLFLAHVVMDEPQAAIERHGNGHAMLGDGVHVRRDNGQVQLEALGKGGVQLGLVRQDVGKLGGQRDVVVGQAGVGVPREKGVRGQEEVFVGSFRKLRSRHGRTCQRPRALASGKRLTRNNARGDVAGRLAGHMGQHHDAATERVHHRPFLSRQLVHRVITAFHVHIRLGQLEKIRGAQLVKDDHRIHAGQSRQHRRAVGLGVNGAFGAFQLADGTVAVQAHEQGVRLVAGGLQVFHVAGVEDVKAAVGDGHGSAGGALGGAPLG